MLPLFALAAPLSSDTEPPEADPPLFPPRIDTEPPLDMVLAPPTTATDPDELSLESHCPTSRRQTHQLPKRHSSHPRTRWHCRYLATALSPAELPPASRTAPATAPVEGDVDNKEDPPVSSTSPAADPELDPLRTSTSPPSATDEPTDKLMLPRKSCCSSPSRTRYARRPTPRHLHSAAAHHRCCSSLLRCATPVTHPSPMCSRP
ncbi:hypothetical protein GQ600_15817 [Phytophthora cactorum]|nr:hypothetical protein GQ600_15817 [Phytophthora cactorum]